MISVEAPLHRDGACLRCPWPSFFLFVCNASISPPSLSTSSGTGSLTAPPMDAAFCSLSYLFALSACACRFEVTVTAVSPPPFVPRRGLFNPNQRLSLFCFLPFSTVILRPYRNLGHAFCFCTVRITSHQHHPFSPLSLGMSVAAAWGRGGEEYRKLKSLLGIRHSIAVSEATHTLALTRARTNTHTHTHPCIHIHILEEIVSRHDPKPYTRHSTSAAPARRHSAWSYSQILMVLLPELDRLTPRS